MSEAASMTDDGQSYSLLFEIAVAIGTTILAALLCNNRRRKSTVPIDKLDELDCEDELKSSDGDKGEMPDISRKEEKSPLSDAKEIELDGQNKKPESVSTQTELSPIEERIIWKAILVDPFESSKLRYKSELYIDVDGTITRTESFQSEGIVGVGMKQILAKVQ